MSEVSREEEGTYLEKNVNANRPTDKESEITVSNVLQQPCSKTILFS